MVRGWIVPEWLERDVTQGQSQQSPPVMSRRLSFLCSDSSAGHRRIYVPPAVKLRRRMVTPAAAAVQQFSAELEAASKPRAIRSFVQACSNMGECRVLLENLWRR